MNDPSQSGPTFPFIAGMMNYLGGVSAGESYFTKLKANGLVINPTNGPTLQALTSGQINLALVQSSAAIGAALGDKNIGIEYLPPVTLLPSAIGIDAKAPAAEQAEAKKFIEFVLSPAGQHVMQTGDPTGDSLYYPVIQGVSPLPALPSLASAHHAVDQPVHLGPAGGHHQHLVRRQHRPVIMIPADPTGLTLTAGRQPHAHACRPCRVRARGWACRCSGCCWPAFILAPCACFLLLAVSPRLFSQGNQWFTLTYLHQALTGATAVAIVNSLWVSCAAAGLGIAHRLSRSRGWPRAPPCPAAGSSPAPCGWCCCCRPGCPPWAGSGSCSRTA